MKNRRKMLNSKMITVGKTQSSRTEVVKIKTETGFGATKTLILFAIFACQIGLYIFLSLRFALAFQWVIAVSFVVSVLMCFYVLSSNKNSVSKAVWIIFLLLFSTFAPEIYLISDEKIVFARAKKKYKNIYSDPNFLFEKPQVQSQNQVVNRDIDYLFNAGNFKAYTNTQMQYFESGYDFYEDVLENLSRAQKFIFLEFFIVSDGRLLDKFYDVISERIKCGVDVRLIFDDMGSHKTFSRKQKKKLKKIGVKLCPFNKLVPVFYTGFNYRDHRKIIVIDGEIAYTGGVNLADEYVNEKRMYGYWKDCGIKLSGPATDTFTLAFLRQWKYLTGEIENFAQFLNIAKPRQNNSIVVPYADGLDYSKNIGKGVYENMLSSANKKIFIMTPYFIPDDTILDILMNKAQSGVEVVIILPEVPDKAFVYGVTRNTAEKLIDYGVKVYCVKHAFVHNKVVLTENSVVVGSINMDLRSFYQQFECAVYTEDKSVMCAVEQDFISTIEISKQITEKNKKRNNVFYRAFCALMQIFAPFM